MRMHKVLSESQTATISIMLALGCFHALSPLPVKTFQPPSSLHRDRYHDL